MEKIAFKIQGEASVKFTEEEKKAFEKISIKFFGEFILLYLMKNYHKILKKLLN